MFVHRYRVLLVILFITGLVLEGCQEIRSAPSYTGKIIQLGQINPHAPEFPIEWEIQRLDVPSYFKYLGRGYLKLRAPGEPCVVYGNDHLYFSCFDGHQWQQEIVDADFGVGIYATLAIDSQDCSHIAYYDQVNARLKYAFSNGQEWQIEVVAEPEPFADRSALRLGTGLKPLIQVDQYREPHITFYDLDQQDLKYAYHRDGIWQSETVDNVPGAAVNSWLALDQGGHPHIAYYDTQKKSLNYTVRGPGGWESQIVDQIGDVGHYASLALDHQSRPHIAYYDQLKTHLKYAVWDELSKTFIINSLTNLPNTGEYASLALDSHDQPHIVYYRGVDGSEVYHIFQSDGEWVNEKVSVGERDLVGLYATIALDSNDRPYFAYRHSSDNQLKVVFHQGDRFDSHVVFQSSRIGEITSLALDSKDNVHIMYQNDSQDELLYTFWDGRKWHFEIVEQAIDTGIDASLKVDQDGQPIVAFWGLPSVKIAYMVDKVWQVEWVEEHEYGDWTGWYPSLALDQRGRSHVSFYDTLNYDLKFGYKKGNHQWLTEIIDGEGDQGAFTWLIFDNFQRPVIAYLDVTNQNLKLSWKDHRIWQIVTLDHVGEVELYPSMACTDENQIYISYVADDGSSLKIGHWNGHQWELAILDQGGHYFKKTSLALDSQGKPHLSYYDGHQKVLKYAFLSNDGWVLTDVNKKGNLGMGSSLAIDTQGRVHISFHDVINRDLMYAVSERH